MVIFDCNGVLVDSEPIAAAVAAREFNRAGIPLTAEAVARYFTGRRPADMFAAVEAAAGRSLPPGFAAGLTAATLKEFRQDLRPMPHMDYALRWLRGPKCVASSSTRDRVHLSLDSTGLIRFFGANLFSASEVPNGKPAPDLFLHVAAKMDVSPSDCIVVEDSEAGARAASRAGMTVIGFIGGSHSDATMRDTLTKAGARTVIADMRALKSTVAALRGW